MGILKGLLASDHRQTLDFFIVGLHDVCEPTVDINELLYDASVLARYAQASTNAQDEFPTPTGLSTVIDNFVLDTNPQVNGALMEVAGAQCLLLAGFFER